jgi:outer membrane protein assembly factor BamB
MAGEQTKERVRLAVAAVFTLLACFAAMLIWIRGGPKQEFTASLPGTDDVYGRRKFAGTGDNVKIGTIFQAFQGVASSLPGAWTGFRGERFDNTVTGKLGLAETWPSNGPPVLWSVELGEGHAGASVRDGRVYVLDYDEGRKADILRCFSLDDGREIWRRGYKVEMKRNHGFSRTIPFVAEKTVVTIGPRGHVMATDAKTGAYRWGFGMAGRYGTKIPGWYTGQCPLVDNGAVILAPAGSNVLMLAVDLGTGETIWSAPPPVKCDMSHASIAPAVLHGEKQYVYAGVGCMVGVGAEGPGRGKVLWYTTEWNASTIAPTPVVFADGKIFCTAGYGAGSAVFQVSKSAGGYSVERTSAYKPRNGFACEQQTPVFMDGMLFGVLPNEAVTIKKEFACADRDGKIAWTSGKENRFGLGPVFLADGKFFILDDEGVLTMARAQTNRYERLAQAKVLNGHDSWAPIALAGTRMLLRDARRMVCLELAAEAARSGKEGGQ